MSSDIHIVCEQTCCQTLIVKLSLQASAALANSTANVEALNGLSNDLANKLELERIQCAGIRAMMDELRDDLDAQALAASEAESRCACLSDQVCRWSKSLVFRFCQPKLDVVMLELVWPCMPVQSSLLWQQHLPKHQNCFGNAAESFRSLHAQTQAPSTPLSPGHVLLPQSYSSSRHLQHLRTLYGSHLQPDLIMLLRNLIPSAAEAAVTHVAYYHQPRAILVVPCKPRLHQEQLWKSQKSVIFGSAAAQGDLA